MKITKRQLRKLAERVLAHPRGDLGVNIADAEFPIVVGYAGRSEIAYNQEELDDILDDVAPVMGGEGIPYRLDSLSDLEPADFPAGAEIERYTESGLGHGLSYTGVGMDEIISRRHIMKSINEVMGGAETLQPAYRDRFDIDHEISEYESNDRQEMIDEYEEWANDRGHITSAASSVIATYLVSEELDDYDELIDVLTNHYGMDNEEVKQEIKRQKAEYDAGGVETDEEDYARGWYRDDPVHTEGVNVKTTKRQLRRIIKEEIDVMNASTGEMMIFADETGEDGLKPDAPELAAREIIKRLNLTPLKGYSDGLQDAEEEIWLGAEDYAKMDVEVGGKRHYRKAKKERARMDVDNLLARVDQWAADAGGDYGADNPEVDMQDVAWDLAAGAQFQFREDEWSELIWHFDNSEDELITYIADRIAG